MRSKKMSAEALAEYIPYDKENAITRRDLARRVDMNDRIVRELIEQARREGEFICNDQDGQGYYRTDDLDILERQYRQDRKRALSILARQKHLRKYLKAHGREV